MKKIERGRKWECTEEQENEGEGGEEEGESRRWWNKFVSSPALENKNILSGNIFN